MKEKTYTLNTMLIAVLGVSLLAAILVRTFAPIVIIPALNIPNMVALSLAALLLDHYIAPGAKRCYICASLDGLLRGQHCRFEDWRCGRSHLHCDYSPFQLHSGATLFRTCGQGCALHERTWTVSGCPGAVRYYPLIVLLASP